MAHANKNFWSVSLTDRPCGILRYPSHIFFSLSLIVKERGHHELSIVLTANFLAATGEDDSGSGGRQTTTSGNAGGEKEEEHTTTEE